MATDSNNRYIAAVRAATSAANRSQDENILIPPFNPVCALDHSRRKRYVDTTNRSGNHPTTRRPSSAPPKSADYQYTINRRDSQYHERCVAQKPSAPISSRTPLTKAELRKADVVSQDKIWKEAVAAEMDGAVRWKDTWGYTLDFDAKGNPIDHSERAANQQTGLKVNLTPITNSGNYGSRLVTELGQKMMQLEFQLSQNTKKKKLDSEMICY